MMKRTTAARTVGAVSRSEKPLITFAGVLVFPFCSSEASWTPSATSAPMPVNAWTASRIWVAMARPVGAFGGWPISIGPAIIGPAAVGGTPTKPQAGQRP